MRRSRSFPVVGLSLCAVLALPSVAAADTTAPAAERAVQPRLLPEDPPWSACIYSMELNQPYWRGHCDGYQAGEQAGRVAGWSCAPRNLPLFPSGTPRAEGYAAGYTVAYKYYYKKFRNLKACALRHGQDRPGPITR